VAYDSLAAMDAAAAAAAAAVNNARAQVVSWERAALDITLLAT